MSNHGQPRTRFQPDIHGENHGIVGVHDLLFLYQFNGEMVPFDMFTVIIAAFKVKQRCAKTTECDLYYIVAVPTF